MREEVSIPPYYVDEAVIGIKLQDGRVPRVIRVVAPQRLRTSGDAPDVLSFLNTVTEESGLAQHSRECLAK